MKIPPFSLNPFSLSCTLVLAAAVLFVGTANAAYIYTLRFSAPAYQVSPGGTVDVPLFLQERVTAGETHRIQDGVNGISTANIRVNWDNTAFSGQSWTAAADFPGTNTVFTASNVTRTQAASPFATGSAPASPVEIQLGTVTMLAPGALNTAILTFSDPSGGTDLQLTGFGALDGIVVYGSSRISNAEPSTFVLTGVAVLAGAAVCRSRRRKSKTGLTV